MSHLDAPVTQGVRFIIWMVTQLAHYPFPGTDIPIIVMILAPWAIYFCWKWVLSRFFDIDAKV